MVALYTALETVRKGCIRQEVLSSILRNAHVWKIASLVTYPVDFSQGFFKNIYIFRPTFEISRKNNF